MYKFVYPLMILLNSPIMGFIIKIDYSLAVTIVVIERLMSNYKSYNMSHQ